MVFPNIYRRHRPTYCHFSTSPSSRALPLFLLAFCLFRGAGAQVNRTFDSWSSSDDHGASLSFQGSWGARSGRYGLDMSRVSEGTYRRYITGTGPASFDFTFRGTSISVHIIVPLSLGAGDYTRVRFTLDGADLGVAQYESNLMNVSQGIRYDLAVFRRSNIADPGEHRLHGELAHRASDPRGDLNTLLLDHFVYTPLDGEVFSPPPTTSPSIIPSSIISSPPPETSQSITSDAGSSTASAPVPLITVTSDGTVFTIPNTSATSSTGSSTSSTVSSSTPSSVSGNGTSSQRSSDISQPTNGPPPGDGGSPNNRNAPKAHNSLGAILGGVIGAIVVALLFGFFLLRRAKRRDRIRKLAYEPSPWKALPPAEMSMLENSISQRSTHPDANPFSTMSPKRAMMAAAASTLDDVLGFAPQNYATGVSKRARFALPLDTSNDVIGFSPQNYATASSSKRPPVPLLASGSGGQLVDLESSAIAQALVARPIEISEPDPPNVNQDGNRNSTLSESSNASSTNPNEILNEVHRLRAEMDALRVQVSMNDVVSPNEPPPAY